MVRKMAQYLRSLAVSVVKLIKIEETASYWDNYSSGSLPNEVEIFSLYGREITRFKIDLSIQDLVSNCKDLPKHPNWDLIKSKVLFEIEQEAILNNWRNSNSKMFSRSVKCQ